MFKIIFDFYEKKLTKNLSKLSLVDLLKESKNDDYYFPYNIWKTVFDKNSIEGGKRISWFATRQLENFNNINEFQNLRDIIENGKSESEFVNSIYFALGNLATNTNNKEVFDFLLNRIEVESEDNIITILISIRNCIKPKHYQLNTLYNLIKNGNLHVKTNAVISLKNSENGNSENLLIERFMIEKNIHLKSMIASTLGNIGTEKSVPVLSEELKIAKGIDYKYFLENSISNISLRN